MEFKEMYESPVGLAKKLEVRWFHKPPEASVSGEVTGDRIADAGHSMPFLHRTLSYARAEKLSHYRGMTGVNVNTKAMTARKAELKFELKSDTREGGQANSPTKSRKKIDLLFKLFKHRIVSYNDALLTSPRRTTRASWASDNKVAEDESIVPPASPRRRCVLEDEGDLEVRVSDVKNENGKRALASLSLFDAKPGELISPLSFAQEAAVAVKGVLPIFQASRQVHRTTSDTQGEGTISFSTVPQTKMFFYYLYVDKDNIPACQVEVQENSRRCPLCFVNAVSDSGILLHCKTSHGDSFSFDAVRSEEGSLHIKVVVKAAEADSGRNEQLVDFVYVRRGRPARAPRVPFIMRPISKAATLDLATRKKKVRLLQERRADSSAIQRYVPGDQQPMRQYYHSRTNLPMLKGEWQIDSDDEPDDSWLHKMSSELLDEFEDISPDEKRFMTIWNRFIKSHTVTSDGALPGLCAKFVRSQRIVLKKLHLRQNLLLHLYNLWDSRLVSSEHILACMAEYDST